MHGSKSHPWASQKFQFFRQETLPALFRKIKSHLLPYIHLCLLLRSMSVLPVQKTHRFLYSEYSPEYKFQKCRFQLPKTLLFEFQYNFLTAVPDIHNLAFCRVKSTDHSLLINFEPLIIYIRLCRRLFLCHIFPW